MLTAADRKIQSEENKKKAMEELFRTLLGNLMTGRIRVAQLEVGA
jgi:type I restriction enzyme S subunit